MHPVNINSTIPVGDIFSKLYGVVPSPARSERSERNKAVSDRTDALNVDCRRALFCAWNVGGALRMIDNATAVRYWSVRAEVYNLDTLGVER